MNHFSASSSGMQQFLAPDVFLTLAPNVQLLSLNTHNFLISEPIPLQPSAAKSKMIAVSCGKYGFPLFSNKKPSVLQYNPQIWVH